MSAHDKFIRANREALGYINLAQLNPGTPESESMRQEALSVLRSVCDDDDLIDEMFYEDMCREYDEEGRC